MTVRLRDRVPGAAVLDPRYSVQLAPCTVCGATLDLYVTDCTYPVSGVTVCKCPRCGTVETAAMREAARRQTGAAIVREKPPETLVCARAGCGTTFTRPVRSTRTHCCRPCAIRDNWERRKREAREGVAA